MVLNKEQLLFIDYVIDTLLYKEAGNLAGEMGGIISTSQLSKLQQLTDSELWKNRNTDVSLEIEEYMDHQSSKKTRDEKEKESFAQIHRFLENRKFEKILQNAGFNPELFPDIINPHTDTGYFIKNLLFKEFIFHFVQEMKMKGVLIDGKQKHHTKK